VYQKLDGKRYINNCIHWLIKKVKPPPSMFPLGMLTLAAGRSRSSKTKVFA
jgi:hypothetical protein